MDQLPEDVLIEIFQYLDNESMFNVMKTCKFFANIFATSSKLLLKFNLDINPQNVNHLSADVPDIPFKNITISNVSTDSDFLDISNFLKNSSNSIEILKLTENFNIFGNFLMDFVNLKELWIEKCEVVDADSQALPLIPSLKVLKIDNFCQNIFKFFVHQKSVKQLKFTKNTPGSALFDSFIELTASMPHLNHIILHKFGQNSFFEAENYPFKVQKFETGITTSWWSVTEPRLNFLKSQQGTLKELTIHSLPYDDDGAEVLKFIIEKMNLKKFYLEKNPLILNGKKQDVRTLTVSEYEVCSMYEMFRQYPIESLTLRLTNTHIDAEAVGRILNPRTNLFENLQSLDVVDGSKQHANFSRFLGLYKNCRNIKKLAISTDDDKIRIVAKQFLPEMTQLADIRLNIGDKNLIEELMTYARSLENSLN
ncbi:uncharacterized protein [Chironomus tepperi]|uniref:uncharacterized protein n=1 Tax=Chironomus tepperi TaxID=113505 RepID=UPI00391EE8A6